MHELFELLQENKLTIIELANDKNQFEFNFQNEDDCPYILVQDNDDEISDVKITKAKIVEKESVRTKEKYQTIEVFIDDWKSWENESIALSTTINNVYMEMYKQLTKE